MEEERMIIFDPLRHRTILERIMIEFGMICVFPGSNNEYIRRCKSIYRKVCTGEPITMRQLQELLDEMYHPLLRPLKTKLAQLDNS